MDRIPVYEGREPYIFVSYAHLDSEIVLPVIKALFDDRYRVWYDEGIAPGSEWPHYIAVHLENADTVVAFVSEASAASVNCENEIVRARELGRNMIVYSIEGRDHERLRDCPHAGSIPALKELLDDRLIGDGLSGYAHSRSAAKRSVVWDAVLGIAVVMVIALCAGIFGLSRGWFDEYLPGRQSDITQADQQETESADTIDSDVLAQAILSQIGKDELMEEISFSSDGMRNSFCAATGHDAGDKITYFDLTNDHREDITLDEADEEVLSLLKYFPELRTAEIKSGDISSISAAAECPRLETLSLGYDIFPVEIPEDIRATVRLIE